MKSIIVLMFCASSVSSLYAQQVTVNWSKESKVRTVFYSWVSQETATLIRFGADWEGTFGDIKYTPVFVKYNEKFAEESKESYESWNKNIIYHTIITLKDKAYAFGTDYNRNNHLMSYYCQPFNAKTLKAEGKAMSLLSFETSNRPKTLAWYTLSRDSSKILVNGLFVESKKAAQKQFMIVYDAAMNKIWQQISDVPYPTGKGMVVGTHVTNEGNVVVIVREYETNDRKKSEDLVYQTKLFVYSKGVSKPLEIIVDAGGKSVNYMGAINEQGDKLMLLGTYTTKHNGGLNGYFFATLNKTSGKLELAGPKEFPLPLLEQSKTDGQSVWNDDEPALAPVFVIAQTVQREDGSRDYILEYTHERFIPAESVDPYNPRPTMDVTEYTYGNIVVINVKPSGEQIITRVPKLQYSRNFNKHSSFKAIPYKDKLLIFYVDNADNIKNPLSGPPENLVKFSKSVLVMATIDAQGHISRSVIADHKDLDVVTCIQNCRIINNNRIALYAESANGIFSKPSERIGWLEIK